MSMLSVLNRLTAKHPTHLSQAVTAIRATTAHLIKHAEHVWWGFYVGSTVALLQCTGGETMKPNQAIYWAYLLKTPAIDLSKVKRVEDRRVLSCVKAPKRPAVRIF